MSKIKTQVIKGVTYVFERTSYRIPGEGKVRQAYVPGKIC